MRFSLIFIILSTHVLFAAQQQLSTFEQGKRQYEAGKYSRALDLFGQAIHSAGDPSLKNKSYYYQGLVLFELGLYYSS